MSTLDSYLPTINYDISKLNLYVQSLLETLAARGETSTDVLNNLFRAYKAAKDKKFVSYIEKKEEDSHDGSRTITYQQLMELAKSKYELRVESGEWNAPSSDEEKILALETTIKGLQSKLGKKQQSNKSDKKAGKGRRAKSRNSKRGVPPDMAWILVPPKPDEKQPKIVNEKEWWFCTKHNKWCRHKTADCQGKGANLKGNTNKDAPTKESSATKIVKALQSISEQDEE